MTPKTVFDLGSNSKQFTADAVLLLAGRHQVALNAPLS
ncbi:serine hydrolase [Streptomyces sp. NBC_01367]